MAKHNHHGSVGPNKLVNLAKHACRAAYADSCVELDLSKVKAAMEADMAVNGFVITKEQIDTLITGDDEGNVPEHLKTCFSSLNHVIVAMGFEE